MSDQAGSTDTSMARAMPWWRSVPLNLAWQVSYTIITIKGDLV